MVANRLTPETVRAAFEQTGMVPTQGHWITRLGCCGVTACRLASGDPKNKYVENFGLKENAWSMGYSGVYLAGFVDGWDGRGASPDPMGGSNYFIGHADGVAAWEAVADLVPAEEGGAA